MPTLSHATQVPIRRRYVTQETQQHIRRRILCNGPPLPSDNGFRAHLEQLFELLLRQTMLMPNLANLIRRQ